MENVTGKRNALFPFSLLLFMTDIRPNWCCGGSFWDHEVKICGKNIHSIRYHSAQSCLLTKIKLTKYKKNNR